MLLSTCALPLPLLLLVVMSALTLHLQHKAQHTVGSRVLGAKVDSEVVHLQGNSGNATWLPYIPPSRTPAGVAANLDFPCMHGTAQQLLSHCAAVLHTTRNQADASAKQI
jgi:hypothetical protein